MAEKPAFGTFPVADVHMPEELDGTTPSKGNGGVSCGIVLGYGCFYRPQNWGRSTYCMVGIRGQEDAVGGEPPGGSSWIAILCELSFRAYERTILLNGSGQIPAKESRRPANRHFIFSPTKPCSQRADTRRARLPKVREKIPNLYTRNSPRHTEPREARP